MMRPSAVLLVPCLLLATGPAAAHHRQTPDVSLVPAGGDVSLPRLPAAGRKTMVLAVPKPGGHEIATLSPFKDPTTFTPVAAAGNHANPSIAFGGRSVAYDTGDDPLDTGFPGRQVVLTINGVGIPVSNDPTGTSQNPSIDLVGTQVAFESEGDLADGDNLGARQIFLRRSDGSMLQVSRGVGTSRNPGVSAKGRSVVFESTSHPVSGMDTGVAQIWLANLLTSVTGPITDGTAPSTDPIMADDGRVVAFESRANLAGGGGDMGVTQIFIYDTKSQTYAKLTSDASGCSDPAVIRVKRDWRIGFVCAGVGYFYMLRTDQRFEVQADGGHTSRVLPQLGAHFLHIATTADLVNGGTTVGHQIYFINLFMRPAELVPGTPATWFPFRGIPPLKAKVH